MLDSNKYLLLHGIAVYRLRVFFAGRGIFPDSAYTFGRSCEAGKGM